MSRRKSRGSGQRPRVPEHIARRDVYLAPFTANGDRVYYSITSWGERLNEIFVPLGADPMEAIDALWVELERVDPIHRTPDDEGTSFSLKLLA